MWNSKHNWQKIPDLTCSMTRPKRHNCLGRRRAISSFFFISSRPAISTGAWDRDHVQSQPTSQPSRHLSQHWRWLRSLTPRCHHTFSASFQTGNTFRQTSASHLPWLFCLLKMFKILGLHFRLNLGFFARNFVWNSPKKFCLSQPNLRLNWAVK